MHLSSRLIRRVVIGVIFLAIFGLTGLGFKKVTTPTPTCTDGIKNGQEEGVDCGLAACGTYCEPKLDPPKVINTKLIKTGTRNYDFIAEIQNPHAQFGASEVDYKLSFLGSADNVLASQSGMFYILPGETKHLVITNVLTDKDIQKTDFKVLSAVWQKLDSLSGMNFVIKDKKYTKLNDGGTALDATILNDSDFDFEQADVDVVLYNSDNDVTAVNHSDIRTFLAGTVRAFKVTWPFTIRDKIEKIEIFPTTNLFLNSNFIKAYGSTVQKFQQY